jgi:lysophospholipid acyltransferase (LPLAT)-like uncharacterized protein
MRVLLHSEALRPVWRLAAPPVAAYFYWRHFRGPQRSARETLAGPGAAYAGAAVYVNWHRHLQYLLIHHGRYGRWLLVSPAPYMLPVHALCRRLGLRLVTGTSGYRGQDAVANLAAHVRAGDSAMLAVDGPAGPVEVVKPGCVHLAQQAGVPIIPVAFASHRGWQDESRWDRMLFAVAGDDVAVVYGAPLDVRGLTVDEACRRVAAGLGAVEAAALSR